LSSIPRVASRSEIRASSAPLSGSRVKSGRRPDDMSARRATALGMAIAPRRWSAESRRWSAAAEPRAESRHCTAAAEPRRCRPSRRSLRRPGRRRHRSPGQMPQASHLQSKTRQGWRHRLRWGVAVVDGPPRMPIGCRRDSFGCLPLSSASLPLPCTSDVASTKWQSNCCPPSTRGSAPKSRHNHVARATPESRGRRHRRSSCRRRRT